MCECVMFCLLRFFSVSWLIIFCFKLESHKRKINIDCSLKSGFRMTKQMRTPHDTLFSFSFSHDGLVTSFSVFVRQYFYGTIGWYHVFKSLWAKYIRRKNKKKIHTRKKSQWSKKDKRKKLAKKRKKNQSTHKRQNQKWNCDQNDD